MQQRKHELALYFEQIFDGYGCIRTKVKRIWASVGADSVGIVGNAPRAGTGKVLTSAITGF